MPDQLQETVSETLKLLVSGKYAKLESLTGGVRLSANEIRKAVSDCGRTLVTPPESAFALMEVVRVKNVEISEWSITMPLWTQEEGRSDLSMELQF